MRRPLPFALAATALMLLIASPALSLKENTAAVAMFPEGFETRVGFELASELGPGALGPVQVLADFGRGRSTAAVERYRTRADLPACRRWRYPVPSRGGSKVLFVVTPTDSARERGHGRARPPAARDPRPVRGDASLGGATAQNEDDTGVISGSLWKVGVFVLIAQLVVLLLVLRSVMLPLKAVLMNALSVARPTACW